jgi:hypothetical protein
MGGKIDLFHQDKYIGEVISKEYISYKCPSGKQLFWASTENKEFLTSDLNAGCSYVVLVKPVKWSGAWKVHVELLPLSNTDKENYPKALKLITSTPPNHFTQSEIDKMNLKLQSFIKINLSKYENEWKEKRHFKQISPDLCIPSLK